MSLPLTAGFRLKKSVPKACAMTVLDNSVRRALTWSSGQGRPTYGRERERGERRGRTGTRAETKPGKGRCRAGPGEGYGACSCSYLSARAGEGREAGEDATDGGVPDKIR